MSNEMNEYEQRSTITKADVCRWLLRNSSVNKHVCIAEIVQGILRVKCFFEDDIERTRLGTVYSDEDFDKSDAEYYSDMAGPVMDAADAEDKTAVTQVRRLLEKLLRNDEMIYLKVHSAITDNRGREVMPDGKNARYEQVFYAVPALSDVHINLLRDAISVYPYAEADETERIVDALNRLTPVYNRREYNAELVSAGKYPGTYYDNLREIIKAFSTIKLTEPDAPAAVLDKETRSKSVRRYIAEQSKRICRIKFKYCEYDEEKKLKVRKKHGEEFRTADPVKLIWTNGFYYLVTFDGKHGNFVNYRVDRMKEVSCLDEPAELPAEYMENGVFNSVKYKNEHPVMYTSGKSKNLRMRCRKFLINNVIDTFGFDVDITAIPDTDYVSVEMRNVDANGVIMWAMEYGEFAEVYDLEISDELIRRAKIIYEKYSGCEIKEDE